MEEGSFPALPYHVPGITTVIIQSSFLLLLNVVNFLLDKMIFCGLVGQVLLGMLWGTPGEQWLGRGTEEVIAQIGYLGLILLVYEGLFLIPIAFLGSVGQYFLFRRFINVICITQSQHCAFYSDRYHRRTHANRTFILLEASQFSDTTTSVCCRDGFVFD